MKKTIYLLLALIITIASCKKKEKETGDFNFFNMRNEPVTIDIYDSYTDYLNRTNAIRHLTVTHELSNYVTLDLKDSAIYYIDYHNSDYSNSNWLQPAARNGSAFRSANSFIFTKGADFWLYDFRYPVAQVLLPGHETKWKAINAYGLNSKNAWTCIWDSMSATEKNVTLKCAPNAFIVNYKGQNGSFVSDSVSMDWVLGPTPTNCTDTLIFYLEFGKVEDYSLFNIGQYKGILDKNGPRSGTDQDSLHASVDTTYLIIGMRGYIMAKE